MILSDIAPGIKYEEAAILDYLIGICTSDHGRIEKERIDGYTWVDYGKLIRDMPLISGKTKITITNKINRLKGHGLIETENTKINGKPRKYIKLTDKCDFLLKHGGSYIDYQLYKMLLFNGMNNEQANEIASNADFLNGKKKRILKDIENLTASDNFGAYVWRIYEQWLEYGI